MQVGKYRVSFERTWMLLHGEILRIDLSVDDPDGRINYVSVHYKRTTGKWWNSYGWKPSITHHVRMHGEFGTPAECIDALMCELRIRSYERGTREYAEAYRDRWQKGVEIVNELPDGWHVMEKTPTNPAGTRWISNGKSLFGGEREHKLLYVGR